MYRYLEPVHRYFGLLSGLVFRLEEEDTSQIEIIAGEDYDFGPYPSMQAKAEMFKHLVFVLYHACLDDNGIRDVDQLFRIHYPECYPDDPPITTYPPRLDN